MPELVLTILKYLFLSLIFLFLARAVRAMLLDIQGPRASAQQHTVHASARAPLVAPLGSRPPDQLAVIPPDAAKPQVFPIEDELIIGRSSKCQVVITDAYASQVHARIFRRDGGLFIEDMGSTNGTYLNRRKVTAPMPVTRGDRARIGKTDLEFRR
ncbi:MAG: FHA domain-containing protein [Actinomycetota bacterium]